MAKRRGKAKTQKKRDARTTPIKKATPASAIAMKEVSDPWEPGRTIIVPVNTRESPIEHMWSRGRLDRTQYEACGRFRDLYEKSMISPLRGMNPMKEPVDGGGEMASPISDVAVSAQRILAHASARIGKDKFALLVAIVGEGATIQSVSVIHPRLKGNYAIGHTSGKLLEAIDDLVRCWNLTAIGRGAKTVADRYTTTTGPSREWEIGRHGDMVEKARP